jgi:hypothetical protein
VINKSIQGNKNKSKSKSSTYYLGCFLAWGGL